MTPKMSIVIAYPGPGGPTTTRTFEREISDDLPAEALGEILCEAVNDRWKDGVDPTDMTIVISFGPKTFRRRPE